MSCQIWITPWVISYLSPYFKWNILCSSIISLFRPTGSLPSLSSLDISDQERIPNRSAEKDLHPVVIDFLRLWLKKQYPMEAFNEVMKILQKVPTTDSLFHASIKTTFGKCSRDVLKENNIQLYIECQSCKGFQSNAMIDMETSAKCLHCGMVLKNENYFIYIGLKEQLTSILKASFEDILSYRDTIRRNYNEKPSFIRDIWDGSILKSMIERHAEDVLLSFTLNTDGVAINRSNKKSIWPIQLYQNSLPPSQRFRNENIVLIGMYVGEKSPNMNAYFFPFISEMAQYTEEYIVHTHQENTYKCIPVISHCVVDLQAKYKLQGLKLYNSHFACTYCMHEGKSVQKKGGPASIFGTFSKIIHHRNETHRKLYKQWQKYMHDRQQRRYMASRLYHASLDSMTLI